MTSDLKQNAMTFLQKRFQTAPVLHQKFTLWNDDHLVMLKVVAMIAQDPASGVKQRLLAIENLGDNEDRLLGIARFTGRIFDDLDAGVYMEMGNSLHPRGQYISTDQMRYAPRIILYTNRLRAPIEKVLDVFDTEDLLIDVIDESEIHNTLFISYGSPDEQAVVQINNRLKSRGVTTWFFAEDAVPGEKLHRVMHTAANKHDRVLLVCSKASLMRKGVLNEIERVLEREAKEGGSDVLLPVTLDDFVYTDWAPERKDIAEQVRARVMTKVNVEDGQLLDKQVDKIVSALRRDRS